MMCEHDLVFGDLVDMSAIGTCDTCSTPFDMKDKVCKYIGDEPGAHRFQVLKPDRCSGCGRWLNVVNLICGNNPLDVTQEFQSLPVRSTK